MNSFRGIRRILVPVDFAATGQPVVKYAHELAQDRSATLRLLHVVGVPVAPFDPAYGVAADPKMLLDLQSGAESALADIAGDLDDTSVDTRVVTGSPSREIVKEARTWDADLIVIGTHGRTGLRHVFLGSVAENVVRLASCPVLTMRLKGFEIEAV
mgnify:CR=1 FL=1